MFWVQGEMFRVNSGGYTSPPDANTDFVYSSNDLTKIFRSDDLQLLTVYTRSSVTVQVPSGGTFSANAFSIAPSGWSKEIPNTVGDLYQSFAIVDVQTNEISSWSTPKLVLSIAQQTEFDADSTSMAASPAQVRSYAQTKITQLQPTPTTYSQNDLFVEGGVLYRVTGTSYSFPAGTTFNPANTNIAAIGGGSGGGTDYVLPDAGLNQKGGVELGADIDAQGSISVLTAAQIKSAIEQIIRDTKEIQTVDRVISDDAEQTYLAATNADINYRIIEEGESAKAGFIDTTTGFIPFGDWSYTRALRGIYSIKGYKRCTTYK